MSLAKDHIRYGPYMPIFLITRTLRLSFWCDACSISAIGRPNCKSQLAKYFQISYALEDMAGRKGRGLKFQDLKSGFCTFFLIYLVISIEHI